MKYIRLGNAGLQVSRICMGCMGFGDAKNGQHSWTLDEEHSREIIKRGLELGVNFFDTAIGYQSGTSEQYLGRALRDFAKREDVVVATKFLPRTQEEIAAGITGQQHIEQMVNTSLKNLGMDYIDLYIYHMWDYETPLYDIMDGLEPHGKGGKGAVHRHFQLLCLSAGQGQRPGGKGGLCQVRLHPGALQPDLPGGGTGDGEALRRRTTLP